MSTQKLNSKQVKDILTNVISKTAEKSVSQGNYDRTILATIQYCIDKTSGQYRIKYQNGYYTAYGQNKDYIYSDGSSVFVLVPQGNFKQKLFITGSASTSSSDKMYLTNLEDDQKYKAQGKNILVYHHHGDHDLDLSSYWSKDNKEYVKYYYRAGETGNCYSIDNTAFQGLKQSEFFKLGVRFKTNFSEARKASNGDYGIRVIIRYEDDKGYHDEVYEINTFTMSGSPFNFSQFVPQTAYWEISEDLGKMIEIREVSGFVRLFPTEENPPSAEELFYDIRVDDISIQSAIKLYDSSDDTYRVNIDGPEGFIFDDVSGVLPLVATLYEYGNEVKDDGLEYYWGKRDATVDSVSNPHYCEHLGQGWYCFNSSTLKKSDEVSIQELKTNSTKTLNPQETDSLTSDKLSFVTNLKEITISKAICRAKATEIICVVTHGGTDYKSQITILTNPDGYYLLVGAQDNQTVHYNGLGYFTIAAGVFYDDHGDAPNNSKVLSTSNPKIEYQWTEYKNGITTKLPLTNPSQILLTDPEWSPTKTVSGQTVNQDNEYLDDDEIDPYLETDDNLACCMERYNYYKDRADYYNGLSEDQRPTGWATYVQRCEERRDGIIEKKMVNIDNLFQADYVNDLGYYILGPSDVTAEYLPGGEQDYVNAQVKDISPRDSGSGSRPEVYNTVYKIPAAKIGSQAVYEVSAIITDNLGTFGLGSQTITLVNEAGTSLDYGLEITNGQQNFMYDERGISPTSDNAIQKIALQPLSFILRNKEGEVLYDSTSPDMYPDIDLAELKPVWKFHDSNYSLIITNYQKPVDAPATVDDGTPNNPKYAVKADDFDTTHMWELSGESYFYYKLKENYNNNYVNSSNVELQLTYNGSYIFGSTNFTFAKQGDLGTNGTNKTLSIYSGVYNNYKNNVLSQAKYCNFNTQVVRQTDTYDANVRYYSPDERHLSKPYLFATKSYASAGSDTPCSLLDGKYVNLCIAQQPYNNGAGINPSTAATFQARWSQSSEGDQTLNDAQWSVPDGATGYNNTEWHLLNNQHYKYKPNIQLNTTVGQSINASIIYVSEGKAERPSPHPYTEAGADDTTISGTFIGNNIISVNAKMYRDNNNDNEDEDPTNPSKQEISTFAYCPLPYYYINWDYYGSGSMEYVDPARHIVLVGGFDQVVYNSDGKNPYYSGEPFKFYLFDKDGKDITYEVIQGRKAGTSTIEWSSSPGIQVNPLSQSIEHLPLFDSFIATQAEPDKDVINIGQMCMYNGHCYKCINNHKLGLQNVVEYGNGEKVTYEANSFIPAWWEEIDINSYWQSMQFVPLATYESLVQQDLFNSWIRLYIRHEEYEAEAFIPINVYCNCYESPELNAWDGKSLVMNDDGDFSYVIANKISAGVKDEQNHFIGLSMGQNIRYVGDTNGLVTPKSEVGLFGFGYGMKKEDYDGLPSGEKRTLQTLFIDAETGKAAFGPSGASQIILDPSPDNWSRLAGWYFSRNFLYKPVGENPEALENSKYKNLHDNSLIPNTSQINKSFGIYVPTNPDNVTEETIVMWAGDGIITDANGSPGSMTISENGEMDSSGAAGSAQFILNYKGQLHASDVHLQGDITATSGHFGTDTDKVDINVEDDGKRYILKHDNFWITDHESHSEVGVNGIIKARGGQIGNVEAADGDSKEAIFIWYNWYPWSMPGDTEDWDSNTHQKKTDLGKNIQYLLYHPNFYVSKNHYNPTTQQIEEGTEVYVEGKIYSGEGRVGGWVIKSNQLMSVDNHTNPTILYSNGNAKFGNLYLHNTGAINNPNDPWWITAEGEAHFTNNGNMFKASKVEVGETIIQVGQGLYIPVGESLRIGNSASLTATTGSGFVFEGSATRFDCDLTIGANKTLGLQNGAQINVTSGLYLDSTGFHTHGAGGNYYWDQNGNAKTRAVSVGSAGTYYWDQNGDIYAHDIWINNQSIENYIKSVISDVFDGDVVTTVAVSGRASVKDVDDTTRSVITSISVGTKHI